MKTAHSLRNKILSVNIVAMVIMAIIYTLPGDNFISSVGEFNNKADLYHSALNEAYAPVIDNNLKKLAHVMEYGDEFCSVYVSTSDSLSVHESVLNEIKTLSDSLCKGCKTEHEKVRAIAYWVAENIYYNHVAAESEVNSDTISLETTLKTRTTTCAGYSNLFSALCGMQGIYCVNLRGGTFVVKDSPEYLLNAPMSHEWSAVVADYEWMYVDTTWLSNNSYTAEDGYVKADDFDDQYFDMSFEYMSYEHRIDLADYRDFKSSVNFLKNKTSKDKNIKNEPEKTAADYDLPAEYSYLSTLRDFITDMVDNMPSFPAYRSGDKILIELTDFDNDDVEDALISACNWHGISYYIINNIDDPELVYEFSAFDYAELLYDTQAEQVVIKYFSSWGHITNGTSETNFIYLGDEISKIKHGHFSGTSGPEEFYIDMQGKKTVCSEEDMNESIRRTEQDLQKFTDVKKLRMTVIEDGKEIHIGNPEELH